MSDRTFDLDALATDLTNAGLTIKPVNSLYGESVIDFGPLRVWDDRSVGLGRNQIDGVVALRIIVSHVDPMYAQQDQTPSAPTVEDLHAKLLDIFSANTTSYGAGNATCSDFDGVAAADAILQLLGCPAVERPTLAAAPVEAGEMPW